MAGAFRDDGDCTVAMSTGETTLRDRHASDAARVDGVAWLPHERGVVPAGGSPITAERNRFTHNRPAAAPTVSATLSLLAHGLCLLAFTLLVSSRASLPDIAGSTNVALMFEPAPAPAAVPATAPAVVHDIVPPPPEPDHAVAPPSEPAPQQAAQPPPPQVAQPPVPPAPVPVMSSDPIRLPPPVEVTQRVPTAVPPPQRTVERQAAASPHSAPVRQLASPAPPQTPAPAEPQSAEVAAARPAAGPLVPPRPVAGMETNRAPAYPEMALRRHETGRVMLRVSVSAYGQPLEVDVAQSSGFPILDSAALSAVRQWRFVPAMQAGTPVAAIAEVPVRFQIDN